MRLFDLSFPPPFSLPSLLSPFRYLVNFRVVGVAVQIHATVGTAIPSRVDLYLDIWDIWTSVRWSFTSFQYYKASNLRMYYGYMYIDTRK